MNLYATLVEDNWGTKSIVIYECGKFAQPLVVLGEGYAEKLAKDILLELKENK